jgi:hypothetical protein
VTEIASIRLEVVVHRYQSQLVNDRIEHLLRLRGRAPRPGPAAPESHASDTVEGHPLKRPPALAEGVLPLQHVPLDRPGGTTYGVKAHSVDPRDIRWEDDNPAFRVTIWKPQPAPLDAELVFVGHESREYEVLDAYVQEVVAWATGQAEATETSTIHVLDEVEGKRRMIVDVAREMKVLPGTLGNWVSLRQ